MFASEDLSPNIVLGIQTPCGPGVEGEPLYYACLQNYFVMCFVLQYIVLVLSRPDGDGEEYKRKPRDILV